MAITAEQVSAIDDVVSEKVPYSPKVRILFLIDEIGRLDGGGTERQILQLIQLSKRLGYEPRLAVLRGKEWLHQESVGCPVYSADAWSLVRPSGWRGCWALVRWMRRERISLVQTFFVECNMIGPWLARLAGVPVVIGSRRNLDQYSGRSRWTAPIFRLMQRLANLSTDCVVANSQRVADTMIQTRRVSRRKMRVAYNGIDVARFSGLDQQRAAARQRLGVAEDELLVGNISCMRPVKGLVQFVDAARLVLEKDPAIRFIIVGDGPQQQFLVEHIRRYDLEDRVRMMGAHKDIRPYLAAMDIGVLSSLAEGFSNSLLEYMAGGLAVVATDVGGNREALDHTGVLVAPDDPAALAAAILELRSAAVRRQFGQAARHRVEQFSLEQAERRMEDVYSEMLNSKTRLKPKLKGNRRNGTVEQ